LNKRNIDGGQALVMGNGDDGLPFARQEMRAVADLLAVTPLVGDAATEAQLYAQGQGIDTLHLAAAGTYQPLEPLFSNIALAAADGQDGKLETYEILGQLDLRNANLVVLSGNRQADLAWFNRGDEITGLAWAFTYAGTPAVLTSNWRVDDANVARFFAAFYRQRSTGVTTAEALRLAQLEMLAQAQSASPYYWAAFSLIGDYQGNGVVETIKTTHETVDIPALAVSNRVANLPATLTPAATLTPSATISNVFEAHEGSELAGVAKSTVLAPASPATDNGGVMPLEDLANGICNGITLPLGLVLLADLFRRGIFRRKRAREEIEA